MDGSPVEGPWEEWTQRCAAIARQYRPGLLREIAGRLAGARIRSTPETLAAELAAAQSNPPRVDRRIAQLSYAARCVLACVSRSRQPVWKVSHLATLLAACGFHDGIAPQEECIQAGLMFPALAADEPAEFDDLQQWLGRTGWTQAAVLVHPAAAARLRDLPLLQENGQPLGNVAAPEQPPAWPEASDTSSLAPSEPSAGPILAASAAPDTPPLAAHQASGKLPPTDGLDWPLRLAVLWQRLRATPARRTQAGVLFKKDLQRLLADATLQAPLPTGETADAAILALLWATASGLVRSEGDALQAAPFPPAWRQPLPTLLAELYATLWHVEDWDPLHGYRPHAAESEAVLPTAGLLLLLAIAAAPTGRTCAELARWLWERHPSWSGTLPPHCHATLGQPWVKNWLAAIAGPLQLVEMDGEQVRLAPLGRWLVGLETSPPAAPAAFPQTLMVQPNAEIVAYRQGLTPTLIAELGRFATWKTLGAACVLELQEAQVQRGLAEGLSAAQMLQTLQQHSSRGVPAGVADLLQRWTDKGERVTLYPEAVLVEFASAADLETALARGLVTVRLGERFGMTADGREPDLRHFRLLANRHYDLAPTVCLHVAADGLTVEVDPLAADLLAELELQRFAEPLPSGPAAPRRYQLTAARLRQAAQTLSPDQIDAWFVARSGQPLPPAARLLLHAPQWTAQARSALIVRLPCPEAVDGLLQWSPARNWIAERLGPQVIRVEPEHLGSLQAALAAIGLPVEILPPL